MNKRGFTLLELLIAATIMAALAVFATRSYQNSLAESHIQDGKTRARAVLSAIERFKIDHPNATFSGGQLRYVNTIGSCPGSIGTGENINLLFNCGYLENRVWSDGYVSIEVCGTADGMCKDSSISPWVCMSGVSDNEKLPEKFRYKSTKKAYRFCLSTRQEEEVFPS